MDEARQYGQMDFNLPHDVVPLPSQGKFYRNKKKSLKVGYLTAADEDILISPNNEKGVIRTLLRSKVYEPDFNLDELLESDAEAILIFLRNTSFGSEYNFKLRDPKDGKEFDYTTNLDELNIIKPAIQPNDDGLFELNLPKSDVTVKCRLLTMGEVQEISDIADQYPPGRPAPVITKRLEKHIVSINGETDRGKIVSFIQAMPISDSKFIRNTMRDCEPRLDLRRVATAPSGEKVDVQITFGAEFFRPFF